MTQDE